MEQIQKGPKLEEKYDKNVESHHKNSTHRGHIEVLMEKAMKHHKHGIKVELCKLQDLRTIKQLLQIVTQVCRG